jgi:hypothetical protein
MFRKLDEGQLHHILGLVVVVQHTQTNAEDHRAVARDYCLEPFANLVGILLGKQFLV